MFPSFTQSRILLVSLTEGTNLGDRIIADCDKYLQS